REVERGDPILALAPAGDLRRRARAQHVAGLAPAGGLAGDGVDAVDRDDRQHVATALVAEIDLVFIARPARDVIAAVVLIDRQRPVLPSIIYADVSERADRLGLLRQSRHQYRQSH